MTTIEPLYVVDVIRDVVAAVNASFASDNIALVVRYTFGRAPQILEELQKINGGMDKSQRKYPLIAVYQDFPEKRGIGYYGIATLPKVVIATLTRSTDPPTVRYDQTFRPILYPVYYEFLKQLAFSKYNAGSMDSESIEHVKWDRLGTKPEVGSPDYVDSIELTNLILNLKQIKTC